MKIYINHLKKKFGEKTAVDIDEFTIQDGEILGLVGNNGAGKSTLFRLMLDLLKADEGDVTMDFGDGTTINPAQSEQWKDHTGCFLDDSFLIDFLTPEEFLDFVGKVNGLAPIKWPQIYAELSSIENKDHSADGQEEQKDDNNAPLFSETDKETETEKTTDESISLRHHLLKFATSELFNQKKLIRDFSAGNKQKIGIVSALYSQPQLVILDEPFNFLDPSSQHQLKQLLTFYHQYVGATILVSSHNLQHTVDISSRVALMENGHIIQDIDNRDGRAKDILTKYFDV